jgi:hypothetical protein
MHVLGLPYLEYVQVVVLLDLSHCNCFLTDMVVGVGHDSLSIILTPEPIHGPQYSARTGAHSTFQETQKRNDNNGNCTALYLIAVHNLLMT